MPTIYLPQSIRSGIEQDRLEIMQQYSEVRGTLDRFNPELRRIDPRLHMVKAHDKVAAGSPMKAGYYHILLDDPAAGTVMIKPLQYDNGEFREPGSWMFEELAKEDMWNDRAMREGRERSRRMREAGERQRQREASERSAEFNERWRSANRTQILVSKSIHA